MNFDMDSFKFGAGIGGAAWCASIAIKHFPLRGRAKEKNGNTTIDIIRAADNEKIFTYSTDRPIFKK